MGLTQHIGIVYIHRGLQIISILCTPFPGSVTERGWWLYLVVMGFAVGGIMEGRG